MPSDSQPRLKLADPAIYSDPGTPDPYAEAARALEQAQRVLSAARATPKPPTMPIAVTEKQFDVLRAEITALKASNEQNGVTIDSLRKQVEDVSRARDTAQAYSHATSREMDSMKEAHAGELRDLHAQLEALHGQLDALHSSNAGGREAIKKERDTLKTDLERLETDRSTFEAERAATQKSFLDNRTYIAHCLQYLLQIIQLNELPSTAQPIPVSAASIPSPPETPITATGTKFPLPSRRRIGCDTTSESPPAKRPKAESPPTVHTLLASLQTPGATPGPNDGNTPSPTLQQPTTPWGKGSYPAPQLQRPAAGTPAKGTPPPFSDPPSHRARSFTFSTALWATPPSITPPAGQTAAKDPRRR
ncbi:hypothetical protein FB451DRAFT_1200866 [Mycena latifolia]|nr:hypothetical protein FB451DRAFT_1200866 [Mycena latifolia]